MLADESVRFRAEKDELEKRHRLKKQEILNQWAKANAKYNVGDILQMNEIIIKVTGFYGSHSDYLNEKLYVTYRGLHLTKSLKPRKDGGEMTIYDDGREIKKLA